MTLTTFEAFGFAEPLSRALTQCGYAAPTPIQAQALSPQLEGRDLLGMAETGSGKTATFVLPILQTIAVHPAELAPRRVRALVLAPTRELAVQIDQEFASLSRNMRIRRAVVLGGVSKGPQLAALKRGVDVLVATPGRLLDLVNMRACDLSHVEVLVLDEADRMFDMGFIRDIKKIVSLLPVKRRTALFSATMPTEIKKFAYDILHDPYRVDLSTKSIVVDRIGQKVMIVRATEKQSRLHTILGDAACERVIVFTRTKRGADRVAERLAKSGISSVAFHGNKAQNARQRALNDFSDGRIRVLVATDIAARGIDVSNVTHVVNFDMPMDPETYVHRVGRTARKGTSGIAISLCDPGERQEILAIERLMKQKIEVIADCGGADLPPAERAERHRDPREDRQGGRQRNGQSDRSGRPARDNSSRHTPARSAEGPKIFRPEHQNKSDSDAFVEADAVFGVAERRPHHQAAAHARHGDNRGNQAKQPRRPHDPHAKGNRHRGPNDRPSQNRGEAAGEVHADRGQAHAAKGPAAKGSAPKRKPASAPAWKGGGNAPNFLKQGGDRGRPRSGRNTPA